MNEFFGIVIRNSPHLERPSAVRVRDRKIRRTTCIRISVLTLIPAGFALQAVGVWLKLCRDHRSKKSVARTNPMRYCSVGISA